MKLLGVVQGWWAHGIMYLSKSVECTPSGANPGVKHGLWVIVVCQCAVTTCTKGTTLQQDVNSGGNCACVQTKGI